MKTIFLLLLLILNSCAPAENVSSKNNVFTISGVNDEELIILQNSILDWDVEGVEVGEGESTIQIVEYEEIVQHCKPGYVYACDEYQVIEGQRYSNIYIRNLRSIDGWKDSFRKVILHELGHHIGNCDAHLEKNNIMTALVELQSNELTEADRNYIVQCPGEG